MAMEMVIIRTDGTATGPMPQERARSYLENIVHNNGSGQNRVGNVSSALNQAFNDQGKPSGHLQYNCHSTEHASAGRNSASSVSLFYYRHEDTIILFAMGRHLGSDTYALDDFHPQRGDYGHRTIRL